MAAKLRGVISNVPLEMSMEDVKNEIQGGNVIEAKRFQMNKGGVKSDSMTVLLVFEKIMPTEVQMGWIKYNVREYIPQPTRCFKCQRMGHTAQQCKWRQRCAKCGGEHDYGKCKRMLNYNVAIVEVTYAEALKGIGNYENKQHRPIEYQENFNDNTRYVVPQNSDTRKYQPGMPAPPQQPCNHKCKVAENTLIVEKRKVL